MTQMYVISFVNFQIAVSESVMTQICVKSSLEGKKCLDTQMCQIKNRDCNFFNFDAFLRHHESEYAISVATKKWRDGTPYSLLLPTDRLHSVFTLNDVQAAKFACFCFSE